MGEGRRQLQHKGAWPGSVTFVGLLNTCANIVALEEGKYVGTHQSFG
jgi:hypothetical protein